jgi:hypothetical protein
MRDDGRMLSALARAGSLKSPVRGEKPGRTVV